MTRTVETPRPSRPAFLGELFEVLTNRGRRLLGRRGAGAATESPDLCELGEALLSRRGEASGVAIAQDLLAAFEDADEATRLAFLHDLAERFGPDPAVVRAALEAVQRDPEDTLAIEALHEATEPRRQELLRRLNLAPGGTAALVRMREELLAHLKGNPALRRVDLDFAHLFASWFNRGFLVLRHIDWNTPASILEKIIRYEAVHAIQNWDDLRNRLQPTDRRCYGFFHPQLVDEPLIFVEVALTEEIPDNVAGLLDLDRQPIEAERASTAVFYSISNTQRGLAGVSFGNFLIKQVVEELKAELPNIRSFVTLSPVPGLAAWLARQRQDEMSELIGADQRLAFALLDDPDWHRDRTAAESLRAPLLAAAAAYFLRARDGKGRVVDPVARFHLGNGARLERLNFLGDVSANGLKQSHGLMVNYLYDLDRIEANHEAFAEGSAIAASDSVTRAQPISNA
ncbi:MCD, Malonyl-CoA decarboxylase MCD [Paracoccus versutus]|uniref:Malonyl-CoA decarboxylase n=1 Tax=Paracoccus versutus TaxID=34007 RepID=A0AAQ0KIZ4_PARVE|nr:malonyl-CoA decarboxylase [Paracoccus versutus]KGJ01854.1 MCD, Malonyl-CoA decarboxylase MCD [Paracoccus versutus]REG27518.1 malonyl-CoA decarboxylase [Paracoccus versutus]WEJ79482.1 MCD, Malonyl-CoA decarboxylase MCD [Paracoccus versutus]